MRIVIWIIRILLFLLLLGFAIKNTDEATLRFFFDVAWQLPLSVIILISFTAGAVIGVFSGLGTLWHQHREIARLRKQSRKNELSVSET